MERKSFAHLHSGGVETQVTRAQVRVFKTAMLTSAILCIRQGNFWAFIGLIFRQAVLCYHATNSERSYT